MYAGEGPNIAPVSAPFGEQTLRLWQPEAVPAVERALQATRSALAVVPTGAGKTTMFGALAVRHVQRGGRVLVLAHREKLVSQARDRFLQMGLEVATEQADKRLSDHITLFGAKPAAVVATVQTLQGKRLAAFDFDPTLIIVDEAHHAVTKQYLAILEEWPKAARLGVTATADRADKKNIGSVFETLAYELTLPEAVRIGAVSRIEYVRCSTGVDLTGIKCGKDFDLAALDERISANIDVLVNATRQVIGDRRAIVFTPDVKSAELFALGLDKVGIKAAAVHGETPPERQEAVIEDSRAGRIQVVCNCQLWTEGADLPWVDTVVIARPSKSRPLIAQMVGRGTRVRPGGGHCLWVDFRWTGTTDLVVPVDLFDDGKLTDGEKAEVAKVMEEGEPDIATAIEKARIREADRLAAEAKAAAEAARRAEERERLRVAKRDVDFKLTRFDPVGVSETMGWGGFDMGQSGGPSCSEKQANLLKRFKINPAGMSKKAASVMIGRLMARESQGLASPGQVGALTRSGVAADMARRVKRDDARVYLDTVNGQHGHELADDGAGVL